MLTGLNKINSKLPCLPFARWVILIDRYHLMLLTYRIRLAYVIYDWVISLDEEIAAFWAFPKNRKLTAATLLYALSRYPPIIEVILIWRTVFPMSDIVRIL